MGHEAAQGEFRAGRAGKDVLAGAILVLIGVVFLSQTGRSAADWVFPRLLTYVLIVIGAYFFLKALLELLIHHREFRVAVPQRAQMDGLRDAVIMGAILVADVLLQGLIGFWAASFLMLAGASFYLGTQRTARSALPTLLVAAVVCAVAYGIFTLFFQVFFPTGSLF